MSLGHGKIKMLLQEKEEGKKDCALELVAKDFFPPLSIEAYSRQS